MFTKSALVVNKVTHSLSYGNVMRSFAKGNVEGLNMGKNSSTFDKVQDLGSNGKVQSGSEHLNPDRIGEASVSRDDFLRTQNQARDQAFRDSTPAQNEAFTNKNLKNVVGGYKATLSNDRVGDNAKAHAEHVLNDLEKAHPGITEDSASTKQRQDPAHFSQPNVQRSAPNLQDQYRGASAGGRTQASHLQEDSKMSHLSSDNNMHVSNRGEVANPRNVMGGYKATLSNPNVSDEAKANAEQVLQNAQGANNSQGFRSTPDSSTLHSNASASASSIFGSSQLPRSNTTSINEDYASNIHNVAGGYKAAINNPRVGEAAKEHAQSVLENMERNHPGATEESATTRYKKGQTGAFGHSYTTHSLNSDRGADEQTAKYQQQGMQQHTNNLSSKDLNNKDSASQNEDAMLTTNQQRERDASLAAGKTMNTTQHSSTHPNERSTLNSTASNRASEKVSNYDSMTKASEDMNKINNSAQYGKVAGHENPSYRKN